MATRKASYAAVCHRYAQDVVDGKVLASRWIGLSCARHLADLERTDVVFDERAAERACAFMELLPHVKGRWAGQKRNFILEPWQCWIVASLFGWRCRNGSGAPGRRRFREAFVLVPRKNGKSMLGAAIGLYAFCADGEFGAEVYTGATTERQAWEVFRPARLMAQRAPGLAEHLDITVRAKSLVRLEDGSRFEPLVGNPGDGASPSLAIVDEYHEHPDERFFDTMKTGMGAREQPLLFVISTAGSLIGGPCHQMQMHCQKVLDGVLPQDDLFSAIYGLDEGDDWREHDAMRKANPNLGVSISEDFLAAQIELAKHQPEKQNAVLTKHFNVWVGARTAWLNMTQWLACQSSVSEDELRGKPCVIAIDLASRIDVAAVVKIFVTQTTDGAPRYHIIPRFYLPSPAVMTARNSQRYLAWSVAGHIQLMDSEEIDFSEIERDIMATANAHDVLEIAYDPWQATQMAQRLEAEGAQMVEFRNTVGNMSPAMREMEAAIQSGRLTHSGNPVLDWMASNVTARSDAKDNIFPRKETDDAKIDGIVATIMGIGRAMSVFDMTHPYDSRGFVQL